ncbi:MAG: hypothetical protein CL569_07090 [Alphaproteobacteria bacterium]|nr:hypothetical protein [Alphaproteobacteria bacterium]|tara:strand:- start:351 stop:680 length:330 start_codon:yes stop_codon:yes gene_type:complete
MKYGLRLPTFSPKYALGDEPVGLEQMGAYLRHAEDLGIEGAFIIDHMLYADPLYSCSWLDPLTLLSAWTGVTRTIKLGTAIVVLPLHQPVLFAKQWAKLDFLPNCLRMR